jgi:hypothetical protein
VTIALVGCLHLLQTGCLIRGQDQAAVQLALLARDDAQQAAQGGP